MPQIAQDIRRFRAELSTVRSNFHHRFKYSEGEILCRQTREVQKSLNKVLSKKENRRAALEHLVDEIDQLKEDMHLANDVNAFRSRAQYFHLYRQVETIGRQAGGLKRKYPNDQNAGANPSVPQSVETLSTHATPAGVNS